MFPVCTDAESHSWGTGSVRGEDSVVLSARGIRASPWRQELPPSPSGVLGRDRWTRTLSPRAGH